MLCPYNLLCNEPMIGIRFQNDLNDCFLCHAIHLRHEIAGRSFGLNGQRFLEMIFEDFSRCFCGCSCDEEGCVEIYHDYCQHTALFKITTNTVARCGYSVYFSPPMDKPVPPYFREA